MGHKISLDKTPLRIISVVPSQTELLYDLGLMDEIIGITKFCVHPKELFRTKTRIGGTKKLDIEKIKSLQPDLIIGNKEENEQLQVRELMKYFPVWISDIKNLRDASQMILQAGEIVGKKVKARQICSEIKEKFENFTSEIGALKFEPLRTAYFVWRKPYICAGGGTFIDSMMKICRFRNVFPKERYPEIAAEEIREKNPELILLSSEPYPFKEKHIKELITICPAAKILLVDGELFSWYGSRLLNVPDYFWELIKQIHSNGSKNHCKMFVSFVRVKS